MPMQRRSNGRQWHMRRWLDSLAVLAILCLGSATQAQESLSQPAKMLELKQVATPDPQRVFRLESDGMLLERMAKEARLGNTPLGLRYDFVLPSYPPAPPPGYVERAWPPLAEIVEPAYLCYGRLYFE